MDVKQDPDELRRSTRRATTQSCSSDEASPQDVDPADRPRTRQRSPRHRAQRSEHRVPETFSGVDTKSLELARAFMQMHGSLARKCDLRSELSHLYRCTIPSWMPLDVQNDAKEQRPFKQVLYALANGMRVVRVIDRGHTLIWNNFCDDEGRSIRPARRRLRDDDPVQGDSRIAEPRTRRERYYPRFRGRYRRRFHPYHHDDRDRSYSPRPRRYFPSRRTHAHYSDSRR